MTESTADPAELEKFAQWSEAWWDPTGPFRPLHKVNPTRLRYLTDQIRTHFGKTPEDTQPLAGKTLVDIGCGGGLISEPMTRLGAEVTGLDLVDKNIAAAQLHAQEADLTINYIIFKAALLLPRIVCVN